MRAFTFLRLTQEMLQPSYQATWLRFMHRMRHNSVRGAALQTGTGRASTGLRPLTPLSQRSVEQPAASPSLSASCHACVTAMCARPDVVMAMTYAVCLELIKVISALDD